jgi:putative tryptophan/tyrosine transport system substrate-binding protein
VSAKVKRRDFITLLGGAAAALSLPARAQQAKRPLVGYLAGAAPAAVVRSATSLGFFKGLRDQGYVEGQDFDLAQRFADGFLERLPALAKELVALKPDVLLAPTTLTALALRAATDSIPIVCPLLENPVGLGLVASENRPDRNVTGLLRYVDGLSGKHVELARDLIPTIARIGLLANVASADPAPRRDVEAAGLKLSIGIVLVEAEVPSDLDIAFPRLAREQVEAVIILHNPLFFSERRRIVTLAAASRLPTIWTAREFVEDGGVLSYGSDEADAFRRAAAYVAKILKGAKAGDLPIELPTKFELLINLKTARALGLAVPPTLLTRADEVIE